MQRKKSSLLSAFLPPFRSFGPAACVLLFVSSFSSLHAEPVSPTTTATIQIFFNESSVVHAATYTLGEIARIKSSDPKQIRQFDCLVMGKSPAMGYRPILNSGQLIAELARQGLRAPEVAMRFPESMFLEREVQELNVKAVEEAIRKEALAQLPPMSDNVLIDKIQMPKTLMLPSGSVTQQIEIRLPRRTVGSGSYTVDFLIDGESQKRIAGSFLMDMEVDALQLQKPLRRGEALDLSLCQVVRRRASEVQGTPLTSDDLGRSSLRARRDLAASEMLSWNNVDRVMLVRSGQLVRMELESAGGMHISTSGQARASGTLGDRIDVINPTSGKIVQAIVAGNQLVKVPF